MTPHRLRALRSFPCAFHGCPPPRIRAAIDAGHAEIYEHHTECYPDRGTTYRLTAAGREALRSAEMEACAR